MRKKENRKVVENKKMEEGKPGKRKWGRIDGERSWVEKQGSTKGE